MIWGGWSCIPHASNATVRNSDTQHLRMRRPAPTAPRPGLASLWALEPSIARANLAVQPVLLVLVLALVLSSACRPLPERSASIHPSIHASILLALAAHGRPALVAVGAAASSTLLNPRDPPGAAQ